MAYNKNLYTSSTDALDAGIIYDTNITKMQSEINTMLNKYMVIIGEATFDEEAVDPQTSQTTQYYDFSPESGSSDIINLVDGDVVLIKFPQAHPFLTVNNNRIWILTNAGYTSYLVSGGDVVADGAYQTHFAFKFNGTFLIPFDINGAQEHYNELKTSIDALMLHDRKVILIGDSYGLDTSWWTGWQTAFNNLGIYTVYKSAVGGSGFVGDPNVNTFLQQLQNLSVPNHNDITDIVVLGGYNDASMSVTEANLLSACQAFSAYANANYPNAKIHFGFIAINYDTSGMQATLNSYANIFKKVCSKSNIAFIPNAQYILLNKDYVFISSGNPNSKFHPSTDGSEVVAQKLAEYLASGYFDVKYGFSYGGFDIYVKNGELTAFPSTYGFASILPAMTYPFNTWTTIADLTATNTNLLWGTNNEATCFKFWASVFTNDNGTYLTDALFRIYNKQIQINPLNSGSGMTLINTSWICTSGFSAPFEAMYG